MSSHPCWRDIEAAASRLTEGDRRLLLLLVHLPLIWEAAIERLLGLRGGASVYRYLARLRSMGLVGEMRVALRARRNPGLLHLTDLGLATVAADQRVDPTVLARQARLRDTDLADRLPGLPQLLSLYDLLVSLADTRSGRIDLLAWELPWRRTFRRATRGTPIVVEAPAHVVLSWDVRAAAFLLLPDLATAPLGIHRRMLSRLLTLRKSYTEPLPTLVIATTDAHQRGWRRLLDAVALSEREAPLVAHVATWSELHNDPAEVGRALPSPDSIEVYAVRRLRVTPLVPRLPGSRIPRPIGPDFGSRLPSISRLLAVKGLDRELLDVIGRHPFLSSDSLATMLGWKGGRLRERLKRMIQLGFVRHVEPGETRARTDAELIELTVDGVELVAAQQGLSVAQAVRYNGLVGGGPQREIGARHVLLRNLEHTMGADAIFVDLYRRLGAATATSGGDAVVEWRNAAACSRRRARPDGYGMIRRHSQTFGFFLEFDRGTMSARGYRSKWSGYYHYHESRAFERDYDGFPTILLVTTDNASEERIARSARAASIGRATPLPLLLTCEWRGKLDPSNPDGLVGPIWREPDGAFHERRRWPDISPT
ncbi:MAG: replication-relaxation family protein [Chloroflexi bacterium]|nr:replication-relaxation family protein [Chloroflexota bacterium]